ncbi:putative RNA-dependent RNA polymerase [Vespa velutina associated menton virus]|nr:putative RNA-dependent RNA polymerase [Vespa velutina associated menton virus]
MIDRMLFQDLFKSFVENPLRTPVAIGWNPLNLGASFLRNRIRGSTFDTDKKHWDWTYPHWLLFDCYLVLTNLTNAPWWWHRVARLRFKLLFEDAVFSFPDGSLVRQQGPGIMKSGCYLTLLLNSLGQWMLHTLCESSLGVKVPLVCFGDDVTQISTEYDERFVSYYESLGFTVESAKHEDMEFCGFHIFPHNVFLPAYKDKHIFTLSHLTLNEEVAIQTLQSYQYLYWFDKPFLNLIRQVAVGRNLPAALVSDDQIMRVVYGR